jgi:hypothetical protein
MTQTYKFTVELTQAEYDAMSYAAADHQTWLDNAIHSRCGAAIEEIVHIAVQQCLANNIQIPGTKDDIVTLAFSKGWVKPMTPRQVDSANATPVSTSVSGQ